MKTKGKKKESSILTIFDYDEKIKSAFKEQVKELPSIRRNKQEIGKELKKSPPEGRKEYLEKELRSLSEREQSVEQQDSLAQYAVDVQPILDRYMKLLQTQEVDYFVGKGKKSLSSKKRKLEQQYLSVARQHDSFGILPSDDKVKLVCDNCSSTDIDFYDERTGVCTNCSAIKELMVNTGCYRDNTRTNGTSEYQYERRIHFRDTTDNFQGKQNKVPDQTVCNKINETLRRYKILVDGNKPYINVTLDHIQMCLKENNLNDDHGKDAQLYHTHLTGKSGPDLSHIEKDLFDDHDKITEIYPDVLAEVIAESNGKWDRKSFLNTEYILFQLLKRRGYPCKQSQFRILKTRDPLVLHDLAYGKVVQRLGWTMIKLA